MSCLTWRRDRSVFECLDEHTRSSVAVPENLSPGHQRVAADPRAFVESCVLVFKVCKQETIELLCKLR